jgi:hypothetical protein
MAKKYYYYWNENPIKKETSDCVIRALVTATGESWDSIYNELCEIGFELKTIPNTKESWEALLIRKGFVRHSISNKKGSKRPTVLSFTKAHKEGTYILQVANHLTVCKEGAFYDLWDCGDKCLYSYWSK